MTTDTLTADAIRAMPAGRELDELVATRVLGWREEGHRNGELYWTTSRGRYIARLCPLLSNDLSKAEVVLDWLRERWGLVEISVSKGRAAVYRNTGERLHAVADTLPLALCRAALMETLK